MSEESGVMSNGLKRSREEDEDDTNQLNEAKKSHQDTDETTEDTAVQSNLNTHTDTNTNMNTDTNQNTAENATATTASTTATTTRQRKKRAGWDSVPSATTKTGILPVPAANPLNILTASTAVLPTLEELTPEQLARLEKAKQFAAEVTLHHHTLIEQQIAAQQQQAAYIRQQQENNANTHKIRHLGMIARIYIGSIPFEAGESDLRQAFSSCGPIKSVSFVVDTGSVQTRHKGFCFLEYDYAECGPLAIELYQGVQIQGRTVKVGKPNYQPSMIQGMDDVYREGVQFPHIFISGIHPDLNESEIKEVFQAFGKVVYCVLIQDPLTNKHKGCGYIQFESVEVAQEASLAMNKFNLGGQTLKVIKAVTPPYLITGLTPSQHLTVLNVVKGTSEHATLAAATAAAIYDSHVQAQSRKAPQGAENGHVNTNSTNANDTAATKSNLSNVLQKAEEIAASSSSLEDDVPIRGNQRYALMQKLARGNLDNSRIVLLTNMVDVEEVDESLEEEIMEECTKFGNVQRVYIHISSKNEVLIFVHFTSNSEAGMAIRALNGRWFARRQVHAQLFDEERFGMRQYSP